MLSQDTVKQNLDIQLWPIDRLILYARNPRKNDAAVDRMCSSIREFGFKIPVLARSDGPEGNKELHELTVVTWRNAMSTGRAG